ncbi:MAG: DDE-type integrase/transposase/recombinase [Ktedonobacteraceae bacterium]|nr:DDE-type integrase/transposase/recombinase [Ktedonobacteraceae bacterium]
MAHQKPGRASTLPLTVITLLTYGCPIQAIVHAFGLDERTVASWRDRAGHHCKRVHQTLVEQAVLDLGHVQADEIRVKGRRMTVWMGLAMMVSTRLWLAGVVSHTRDTGLADRLLAQVRRCCQAMRPLLVCTDGWAAYPGSIRRAFREKVKRTVGPGRSTLVAWPEILIATVIKHTQKRRVVEITRRMTQGTIERAQELLTQSKGGSVLNTACIERLNATFRERLATLTRRCRHAAHRLEALETAMYLIGCVYHFCVVHDELSSSKHTGSACTPAMAAKLTDRVWSVTDVLTFRVPPPSWVEPKRRGRPPKEPTAGRTCLSARPPCLRPLLRLRKGAFHAFTG